jgi:GTP diphosphokinase / guanosine-3',5'-bis(diphosphate) 3'-diphosphatase
MTQPPDPGRHPEAWLLAALEFAAHKHRNQRRKDAQASPYINHPIALAHMLVAEGGVTDTKTLVAAILHDTVEDTDTTCEEIRARFGKLVADVVQEVTDDKALPKARRKQLQIEHAPRLSKRAALVKLADKTANLRDMVASPPAGWPLRRRQEYFDWAHAVVAALPPVNKKLRRAFDEAHAQRPRADGGSGHPG